jgi:hypothetical protein
MTPSENDESLLSAYLDDEVSPEERQWIEAKLAEDPRWRQLLDELRGVQLALAELPLPRLPGGVASQLWLNPAGDDEERVVSPRAERRGERAVEQASPARWRVGLTLAASLLLLLAVWGWRVSQRRGSIVASRPAATARPAVPEPSVAEVSAEAAVEAAPANPGLVREASSSPTAPEAMGGSPSKLRTNLAAAPSSAPADSNLVDGERQDRMQGNGPRAGGGMAASDSALVGEGMAGWETAFPIAGRWSSPPPAQGTTPMDPVDRRWLQQHFRVRSAARAGAIVWMWEPRLTLDRETAAGSPPAAAPPAAAQSEFAATEGLAAASPIAESAEISKPALAAQARQAVVVDGAGSAAASQAGTPAEYAPPANEELPLDSAVAVEVVVPAAEWERLRAVFIRQGLSFEGDGPEPSKHRWFRIVIPPAR